MTQTLSNEFRGESYPEPMGQRSEVRDLNRPIYCTRKRNFGGELLNDEAKQVIRFYANLRMVARGKIERGRPMRFSKAFFFSLFTREKWEPDALQFPSLSPPSK